MNGPNLEILATPDWRVDKTPIERWVGAFEAQGLAVHLERESPTVTWLEIPSIRLRGYALMQGLNVEAIDFELNSIDPQPARTALETAAQAIQWELDDEPLEDDES